MSIAARIDKYTAYAPPSDCVFWIGAVMSKSQKKLTPCLKIGGRVVSVRKLVYELEVGEILEPKIRITNRCGEGLCIAAHHIEAVWTGALTAPGRKTQHLRSFTRTYFRCGHRIPPENTVKIPGRAIGKCRACKRASNRAWKRNSKKVPL
jgi:hypothetical protein